MATCSELEGLHDEYFEYLCSTCRKKNRNTEADKFCTDCESYFCKNCIELHNYFFTSPHKILDQALMGSSQKFPEVPTERCKAHGYKPTDMLCIQHDRVGCAICMMTNHSTCKKAYVPDHVKNNFNPADSRDIEKKLEHLAKSLHDLEEEYDKEKEQHASQREGLVRKICTFRTQINQRIDELENITLEELDDELETQKNKMEKEIKELKEIIKRVEQSKDSIDSAGGNLAQQFVSLKIASEVASNVEAMVNKTRDKHTPANIDFTSDQTLLSLLNQMQNLGTISMTYSSRIESSAIDTRQGQSETNSSDTLDSNRGQLMYQSSDQSNQRHREQSAMYQSSDQSNQRHGEQSAMYQSSDQSNQRHREQSAMYQSSDQSNQRHREQSKYQASSMSQQTSLGHPNVPSGRNKSSLLKIKGCKKYSIKMKSDKNKCSIKCACVLVDGTVLITEHSNTKLKCLDKSTFMVTSSCDLPGDPRQVCAVRQQEVAVACGAARMIQFVSVVGSTLQRTSSFTTDIYCCALAYADGKLYVADLTSVYVYTLSGTRQDQFGQGLFSCINRLAISRDNSRIYVTDHNKGLIILNITSHLVGQFNPPELDQAYGVCLHNTGNVLVCGHRSNNVLQFDADGLLIGEVLKTDKDCQAICFNKNYSQLIIGYRNNDEIEIHDIL